jgi:putative ABC transport system permease protein
MSWRRFFRRGRWDDERRRELEAHLDLETDDNIARGMRPDDARTAARRKLGNATRIREEIYDMNTIDWLESLWQDVRYAARVLRRSRSFAVVAILSLMLGVGANTAIFQLIDAVRLRTLPVPAPETLAEIRVDAKGQGRMGSFTGRYPRMSYALWERIQSESHGFTALFAWGTASFDLASGGESRPVDGIWVSGSFFDTLGIRPAAGRLIGPSDDRRGCGAPGVVLSHRFWEREYGADPGAVGRSLRIDGIPMPVLGVSGERFFGLEVGRSFDVAVPLCVEAEVSQAQSALDRPDSWWLSVMGRLPPGTTAEQASARLAPLSSRVFEATVPPRFIPNEAKRYREFLLTAAPAATGVSELRRDYEQPLWLLLAIAGAVLLIACGNLANLMLARASAREREIAVRLAIGASRSRIFRQLLVESLLVAAVGAALGTWLAGWLSHALVSLIDTARVSYFVDLQLSWRTVAFASGLAVLTCAVFGLVPAIRATKAAPGAAMKSGARGSTDDRRRVSLRRVLVVGQVGLSLVLVMMALLFGGTLRNLLTAEPGFQPKGVLVADFDLRRTGVPADRMIDYHQQFIRRVAAIPGVAALSQAAIVPLSGSGWNETIVIEGQPRRPYPRLNSVGPRFFETLRIPLVAGRLFDERDTLAVPRVAIVNEEFGRVFFNSSNPLGREFHIEVAPGAPNPVYRIVGVVKNSKYGDLREDFGPLAYFPDTQDTNPVPYLTLVARGEGTASLAPAITAAARETHPEILVSYRQLDELIHGTLVRERLMATLSGFFGILAGLLAAVGLYGVMSYLVTRRRFEIGLRMALGADRARVLWMVLRESGVLVTIGLVAGIALAFATKRWSAALLYGLSPADPWLLALAAAGLAAVAAFASLVPARRASLVEPTTALRND